MTTVGRYTFPDELWYERTEHLWVRREAGTARLGLDALALDALGQIVHLALPEPGTPVRRGEEIGSLEAEKMVSPLVSPITGTVRQRNDEVVRAPGRVHADPYGEGWLLLVDGTDLDSEVEDLVSADLAAWAEAEVSRYRDEGWVQ